MTAQPEAQPTSIPAAQVIDLVAAMVKALRAFQIYLPNNPIYQRAVQNVQSACKPIWSGTEELMLNISESELIWEEQVVYRQPNKNESLTWSLFKDGMRALTLRRGAEEKELPLLLATVNQARFLPPDAGTICPRCYGPTNSSTSSTVSSTSSLVRAAAPFLRFRVLP